jgi:hypothetical protein
VLGGALQKQSIAAEIKLLKKFYKNSFVWARQQVVWFSCWRVFLCTPPVAAV